MQPTKMPRRGCDRSGRDTGNDRDLLAELHGEECAHGATLRERDEARARVDRLVEEKRKLADRFSTKRDLWRERADQAIADRDLAVRALNEIVKADLGPKTRPPYSIALGALEELSRAKR